MELAKTKLLLRGALLFLAIGLATSPHPAQGDSQADRFIRMVLPWAQAENNQYGTPVSVAIGQAAQESTWGRSSLAATHNNYLGLKDFWGEGSGYASDKVYLCNKAGTDCAWYNTYAGGNLSFLDHGWGLKNYSRYSAAWEFKCEPKRFIQEVAKAGYAADPNYAKNVIAIMDRHNLYQYDTCKPPPPPPAAGALDVFLLVDLSGSFWDDLPVFKAQAPDIISSLRASNPDSRFGLAKFEDYPIPPFGSAAAGDKAYERLVDLTFDTDLVLDTISGLFTRFGDDAPQSQLPALYQAATGAGQDLSGVGFPGASIPPGQQANFRDGATKLFLLWTDAPFHQPGDPGAIPYPGPSFSETVDAILALDPPKVIGISSGPFGIPDLEEIAEATGGVAPADGVDCDGDGTVDILEGEPLVCGIAPSGEGIGEAITALVEAAAGPIEVDIDIKPGSAPNSIDPSSAGVTPVGILSTPDFDAPSELDKASLTFGRTGDEPSLAFCPASPEDVNSDGLLDQVCHFETQVTGFQLGDTEGILRGQTVDGVSIEGRDAVRIVPP